VIAGAKTLAARPSLRRCAEIGRPLFAAASAILAAILCPVCGSPSNTIGRDPKPGASGVHPANSARVHLPEKRWILRPKRHSREIAGSRNYRYGVLAGASREHRDANPAFGREMGH